MTNIRRLFLAATLAVVLNAEGPTIRMENGSFVVSGVAISASAPESIFVVYAGTGDVPAMLGSYAEEAGALVFRPRYPLSAGVAYRVVVNGVPVVEKTFHAPAEVRHAPTRISHIYPSSDVVPENTLKLYIEFDSPMSRGFAWQHIRLLDTQGKALDLPFLEVDQELWDPAYRRMTVLFDPGRIKRGLVPNQNAGSPIEEGKQYTLVIDRGWPDAQGNPLAEETRKSFRVGAAERAGIDLKTWKIGVGKTLTVSFPRPLDAALLSHAIRVLDAGGNTVEGTGRMEQNETHWVFAPASPWPKGDYKLEIDMALEDLAGNRIGRAFDVDVFDQGAERISRKTVQLAFRVSGQ